MALAARVHGDAAAPIEASLGLGRTVEREPAPGQAEAAYAQALDLAQRISTKYK